MRKHKLQVLAVAAGCCVLTADPAWASFHLMQIEQVIGGVNADTSAQAIQLRMRFFGQNFVAGKRIIAVDAQGLNPVVLITIPGNVGSAAAGARVLLTTSAFTAMTDPATTPDFILTNAIPASYLPAGSITFEDNFTAWWRLSWGGAGYTGPTNGSIFNDPNGNFGPPWAGPLPSSDLQALKFQGPSGAQSTNNAADYALTVMPAVFTNNANDPFTVGIPLGACCDDATATCDENVTESDCTGVGFRYGGDDSTCATIDPPCTGVAAQFIPGDINDDGVFDIADPTVLRRDLAGLGPGITQMCFAELPATGQVTCFSSGGSVIPCAGTGQDGDNQAGAPLAYQDNGDGTVTDLNTGLTWEKLSDDGSIHDRDDTYAWDDAFGLKIATLNSTAFAGHTDWRVPNVKELPSIVDYEVSFPSVSPAFNHGCVPACTVLTCSCTASFNYWSSSSGANFPDNAWFVFFTNGNIFAGVKRNHNSVRAVRGP